MLLQQLTTVITVFIISFYVASYLYTKREAVLFLIVDMIDKIVARIFKAFMNWLKYFLWLSFSVFTSLVPQHFKYDSQLENNCHTVPWSHSNSDCLDTSDYLEPILYIEKMFPFVKKSYDKKQLNFFPIEWQRTEREKRKNSMLELQQATLFRSCFYIIS